MNILGIETSCDETAAAVVQGGTKLLSNVIVSQIDIHQEFGGVVPEVAARSHIEVILPTIEKALREAFYAPNSNAYIDAPAPTTQDLWAHVDGIAVANGPGLSGSLLIGVLAARTLSMLKDKPLYALNHVEAHTYANFITEISPSVKAQMPTVQLPANKPAFPLLSLTVSGGHSQLVLFSDHGIYQLLGQTRDDAVGEAFDKVAKLLGLGYPGGPAIAAAAESGDPHAYRFPKAKLENRYDFSFSGLKTAVLRHLQKLIGESPAYPSFEIAGRLTKQQINDTAASFQRVAVETLVEKTVAAEQQYRPKTIVIAGGVAANQALRLSLSDALTSKLSYAPPLLCTDNAAMLASLGYFTAQKHPPAEPLSLEIYPSLSM